MAPLEVAVPQVEAVELADVRGVERREIAVEIFGAEQPTFELGDNG